MSLSRRSLGPVAMLAATSLPILLAVCCTHSPSVEAGGPNFLNQDFVLSPDGRVIAFGAGSKGIGLYEWRTGQMETLPLPAGVAQVMWLRYSADGGKLSVVAVPKRNSATEPREATQYKLAIFDIQKRQADLLDVPGRVLSNPVLRSDGKAVLYAADNQLFLYDLVTGQARSLLTEQDRFSDIRTPTFVDNNAVLFVARNPKSPKLKAVIEKWGGDAVAGTFPYILKSGTPPEIAYPEFVQHQLADRYGGLPGLMPASRNGERVVFIGPSQGERARRMHATGRRPYDLFVLESNHVRQVTQLENYMAFDAISYDGSTAAVGVFVGPHSEVSAFQRAAVPLQLAIVDLTTGQMTRTDFVARAAALRSDSSPT